MKQLLIGLILMFSFNIASAMDFEVVTENIQRAFIHFDTDKSFLSQQAKEKLAKLDMSGDDIELIVIGKTDKRGSSEYNQRLGLKRAESVASYLDVSNSSISSVGESESMIDCKTKINCDVKMGSDRVAVVKVITEGIAYYPLFGLSNNLQGPTSHLQYNTVPVGQGMKVQPKM